MKDNLKVMKIHIVKKDSIGNNYYSNKMYVFFCFNGRNSTL